MNLGHQCRIDQSGCLEQPIVIPSRMLGLEHVADRVVLTDEERVQQAQPDPPAAEEASQVEPGEMRMFGKPVLVVLVHLQLTVRPRAQVLLHLRITPIDLRPIPPKGPIAQESWRPRWTPLWPRWIRERAFDFHRVPEAAAHPGVLLWELNLEAISTIENIRRMAGPVVYHELDPGSGQEVERFGRFERIAIHQPVAHLPGTRLSKGVSLLIRHIATVSRALASHSGAPEVIIGSVRPPVFEVSWLKGVGHLERIRNRYSPHGRHAGQGEAGWSRDGR